MSMDLGKLNEAINHLSKEECIIDKRDGPNHPIYFTSTNLGLAQQSTRHGTKYSIRNLTIRR